MNSAAVDILIHVFDEPRCSFLMGYLGINCRESRGIGYLFILVGSKVCTLKTDQLSGTKVKFVVILTAGC